MIENLRDQIQQRIDELSAEADRLRAALTALGGSASAGGAVSAERSTRSSRARSAKTESATPRRSRRSQSDAPEQASSAGRSVGTRAAVLAALQKGDAMTASEVAAQTGLGRASVSTTLSKLAKSGEVQKAQRGYQLVGSGNGASAGAAHQTVGAE